MDKHANTLFPGEKVTRSTSDKLGSAEHGRVIAADPDTRKVKVDWGDHEGWYPIDELTKVP